MQRCRLSVGQRELMVDAEALAALDPTQLAMAGNGSISATLRWRDGLVVKPLPAFPSRASFEEYASAIEAHLRALREAGVEVLAASVEAFPRPEGSWAAYIVQPEIPADRLLSECLRISSPAEGLRWFDRLATHVEDAVTDRVGLDADVTNWCVEDGRLALLDISTPMLRDAGGRLAFSPALFMQDVPRVLRPLLHYYVRKFLVRRFFERRLLLIDVLSGFKGERLLNLLPGAVERASRHVQPAITEAHVEQYRKRNERFWRTVALLRGG